MVTPSKPWDIGEERKLKDFFGGKEKKKTKHTVDDCLLLPTTRRTTKLQKEIKNIAAALREPKQPVLDQSRY